MVKRNPNRKQKSKKQNVQRNRNNVRTSSQGQKITNVVVNRPMAENMSKYGKRVKGQVSLASISDITDTVTVFEFDNSFAQWAGTRLGTEMSIYDKYFVHSLKLSYVTETPLTEYGTIHMAFDVDCKDQTPSTDDAATYLAQMYTYVSGSVARNHSCTFNNIKLPGIGEHAIPLLYVTGAGDPRLQTAGKFYVVTDGVPIQAGATLGRLILEYDISLCFPQVEPAETPYETVTLSRLYINMNSGWHRSLASDVDVLNGHPKVYAGETLAVGRVFKAVIASIPYGLEIWSGLKKLTAGDTIFFKSPDIYAGDTSTSSRVNIGDDATIAKMSTQPDFSDALRMVATSALSAAQLVFRHCSISSI